MSRGEVVAVGERSWASKGEAAAALRDEGKCWDEVGKLIGTTASAAEVGARAWRKRLGQHEQKPRGARARAHRPDATAGWTPGKAAKVRRLFGETMIYIADAVQVPAGELLAYVLHGVIPPSQPVSGPDDIRWNGQQGQLPAPAGGDEAQMLPRDAFEAVDDDAVIDSDEGQQPFDGQNGNAEDLDPPSEEVVEADDLVVSDEQSGQQEENPSSALRAPSPARGEGAGLDLDKVVLGRNIDSLRHAMAAPGPAAKFPSSAPGSSPGAPSPARGEGDSREAGVEPTASTKEDVERAPQVVAGVRLQCFKTIDGKWLTKDGKGFTNVPEEAWRGSAEEAKVVRSKVQNTRFCKLKAFA